MTITRGKVIAVMAMLVLWAVAFCVLTRDRTIYVSNLDDANAAESTPSVSPTNQLPTMIEERR